MANVLDGIKVVEVASFVACPAAGLALGDFGAEVLKIEPLTGDPFRAGNNLPPAPTSDVPYTNMFTNRNKKSVALNLKDPEAQKVLYKLVEKADVFLTNSMPHVCDSLGISFDTLIKINPRLVYGLITGYGDSGPEADTPGFDGSAWFARTGLAHIFRAKGADPIPLPVGIGDQNTATSVFAAVMTGLYHRERTGKGCKVQTSLMANGIWTAGLEAQAQLVGAKFFDAGHADSPNPLVGTYYKTKDNRYVLLMQVNPRNWDAMCDALSAPAGKTNTKFNTPGARVKNNKELIAAIDKYIGQLDLADVAARLRDAKTNFSVVQNLEELVKDPQAAAQGFFPLIDGTSTRTVASPIAIEGITKVARPAPAKVGQDTKSVLKAAGYSDDQIEKLAAAKAIGVA
jgi:crotonobetainyl-CoA:carnitine CoA-transferase CaiB-like acyl-CoA transferase